MVRITLVAGLCIARSTTPPSVLDHYFDSSKKRLILGLFGRVFGACSGGETQDRG
jgi:hypothetical protein